MKTLAKYHVYIHCVIGEKTFKNILIRPGKLQGLSRNAPPSKALFSLDSYNPQLHCFLGLGTLFCCSFFSPLDQPCKTLQMVQVTLCIKRYIRAYLLRKKRIFERITSAILLFLLSSSFEIRPNLLSKLQLKIFLLLTKEILKLMT